MSGLPTATDLIWDLKRRYYCREENQDVKRQDMQLPAVAARIQAFMDSRGFPELWADEEYTTYFEKIFGTDRDRQSAYLRGILAEDRVRLTVGNRVMGALLAGGFTRLLFTTNFDSVVERAVAEVSGRSISAFHLEGPTAAAQALANEEWPIYCKLHGDFRYDSVKNLSADLAEQDAALAGCMLTAASRSGFIIAGYSGRDESVMRLFRDALERPNPFPHGLFWTGMRGAPILPAVTALIEAATKANVQAAYVEADTFDALMLRLWRNLSSRPADLDAKVRRALPSAVSIALPKHGEAAPVLRLNALPITKLPTRALGVRTREPLEWRALRVLQGEAESKILVTKAPNIVCWGDPEAIATAFKDHGAKIEGVDLPADLTAPDALPIKGFIEEGFATALARDRPLLVRRRGNAPVLIADAHSEDLSPLQPLTSALGKLTGQITGLFAPVDDEHPSPEKVFWAEAARISIAQKNGQDWLLVDPDIWIWPPRAREVAREFLDTKRKDRMNAKFDIILTAWIQALAGTNQVRAIAEFSAFDSDHEDANPRFAFSNRSAYSKGLVP